MNNTKTKVASICETIIMCGVNKELGGTVYKKAFKDSVKKLNNLIDFEIAKAEERGRTKSQ